MRPPACFSASPPRSLSQCTSRLMFESIVCAANLGRQRLPTLPLQTFANIIGLSGRRGTRLRRPTRWETGDERRGNAWSQTLPLRSSPVALQVGICDGSRTLERDRANSYLIVVPSSSTSTSTLHMPEGGPSRREPLHPLQLHLTSRHQQSEALNPATVASWASSSVTLSSVLAPPARCNN